MYSVQCPLPAAVCREQSGPAHPQKQETKQCCQVLLQARVDIVETLNTTVTAGGLREPCGGGIEYRGIQAVHWTLAGRLVYSVQQCTLY